jgi:hypothetical protein
LRFASDFVGTDSSGEVEAEGGGRVFPPPPFDQKRAVQSANRMGWIGFRKTAA